MQQVSTEILLGQRGIPRVLGEEAENYLLLDNWKMLAELKGAVREL